MRLVVRCLVAATLLGVTAGGTLAAEVQFHRYSVDELKAACQKSGGSFSQGSDGYGCGTDCKGASGTDCTVFCPASEKRCTAQVIGRLRPKSAEQALAPQRKSPR